MLSTQESPSQVSVSHFLQALRAPKFSALPVLMGLAMAAARQTPLCFTQIRSITTQQMLPSCDSWAHCLLRCPKAFCIESAACSRLRRSRYLLWVRMRLRATSLHHLSQAPAPLWRKCMVLVVCAPRLNWDRPKSAWLWCNCFLDSLGPW